MFNMVMKSGNGSRDRRRAVVIPVHKKVAG